MTRVAFALCLATVGLLAGTAIVSGHAAYDYSTPGDGEVLTIAPTRVDVYFTQDLSIQDGASTLNVVGPAGDDVDNNDAAVDPADRTHMSVTLQSGLTSGEYTVEWSSTSFEDGDTDNDTFTFTVGLGGAPTATPAAPSGGTPAPASPAATAPAGQVPSVGSGPGNNAGGRVDLAVALAALGASAALVGGAMRLRTRRE